MRTNQTTKVLRVRADRLRQAAEEVLGLTRDKDIAERLGHDLSAFSRLMTGTTQPSGKFIVSALDNTGRRFEDLFEIRSEEEPCRRRRLQVAEAA